MPPACRDAKLRLRFAAGAAGARASCRGASARGFQAALDWLSRWRPPPEVSAASRHWSLFGAAGASLPVVVFVRSTNASKAFLQGFGGKEVIFLKTRFTFYPPVNQLIGEMPSCKSCTTYLPPHRCMSFSTCLNADAEDVYVL